MSALILPSRFTTQPQYPAPIDYGNPLTAGIYAFTTPNHGGITVISGVTKVIRAKGIAWNFSESSQSVDFKNLGLTTGSPLSGLAFCRSTATGNQAAIGINYDGSTVPFVLNLSGNYGLGVGYFGGGWTMSGSSASIEGDGIWHVISGSSISGSQRFFVDGGLKGSATGTGTSAHVNTNSISFGNYKSNSDYFKGDIALAVFWNRFLTDAEHKQLASNPWQIFKAQPRFYFSPEVGGSGVTTAISSTTANAVGSITSQSTAKSAISATTANAVGTIASVSVAGVTTTINATTANAIGNIVGYTTCKTTISSTIAGVFGSISSVSQVPPTTVINATTGNSVGSILSLTANSIVTDVFSGMIDPLFEILGIDATLGVTSVRGVFDERPRDEFGVVGGNSPRFTLKTESIPADPRSLSLIVGSKTYAVRDWTNDGSGVSILQLES